MSRRLFCALLFLVATASLLFAPTRDTARADLETAAPGAAPIGPAAAGGAPPELMMLEATPGEARVRLLFLPDDAAAIERPSKPEVERLTVTGAYSSGDRFGPEGFVLKRGEALRPVPQGWDGVLLVDAEGRARIFDVSAAELAGDRYNLRDVEARRVFLRMAESRGLSAIQSHLLVKEGVLDLKPVDGARRFRRRLLFQTEDGRIGVFDTSPKPTTLFEAAVALKTKVDGVHMALNLDMGTYDFCVWRTADVRRLCGVLTAHEQQALTNLIEFELPISK